MLEEKIRALNDEGCGTRGGDGTGWMGWGHQVKVFSIWAANSAAKVSRRCARSRMFWRK
jgi:hypothetical protein